MNTSLFLRSFLIALAFGGQSYASHRDDIATLDSIIADTRTAPFQIKVGMDQKQVTDVLGKPDVVVGRNFWGYFNVRLHARPPGEHYDALMILVIDGRVRMLRLTTQIAVSELLARLDTEDKRRTSGKRVTSD